MKQIIDIYLSVRMMMLKGFYVKRPPSLCLKAQKLFPYYEVV